MKKKLSFSDKKFLIKCWKLRQTINNDVRFFNALTIAASSPREINDLSQGIAKLIRNALLVIESDEEKYNA